MEICWSASAISQRLLRSTGDRAGWFGSSALRRSPGSTPPVELTNGNLLMFDNGPTRLDQTFPFSRVIEVNPATKEIVWKYQDANPQAFYSDRISNAQRLPNGNTLINEGMFGRFFEVTPAGEVVWEYVNPYFGPASRPAQTQTNSVFRVYRYTEEEVAQARRVV